MVGIGGANKSTPGRSGYQPRSTHQTLDALSAGGLAFGLERFEHTGRAVGLVAVVEQAKDLLRQHYVPFLPSARSTT